MNPSKERIDFTVEDVTQLWEKIDSIRCKSFRELGRWPLAIALPAFDYLVFTRGTPMLEQFPYMNYREGYFMHDCPVYLSDGNEIQMILDPDLAFNYALESRSLT